MAMEEIKLTQNVHNEALSADVSDKKKGGKFQPFKKLFGKRKKKDTSICRETPAGKKSHTPQSISNGTFSSDEEDNLRSFNYSMGSRAFSHDSIFIPDGGAESEQTVQAMSQDNILGKVKTLQRQLGKNIKFGQPPPGATPMKKADSGEASLEEEPCLTSPMEIVTQQDIILSDAENKSTDTPSSPSPPSRPGARSEMEEKVAPAKPSRPKRHFSSAGTIESVNLDAIPLAIARLDNSAAKHKLSVKPKKNQRVSKKHRRLGLAWDRPSEQGGLPSQLSLDQNGHPGEDKPTWHEEEPEPLDSEEEKRCQEEYWRELEAKCKRQKAEAAERRRLEEQRLQALERRLWEENRRQELLEEGEEGEPGLEVGGRQLTEERRRLEEQGGHGPEWRGREEGRHPEQEAERPEELEARSRPEAETQRQEGEEGGLRAHRRLEGLEELEERRLEELEERRLQEERERRLQEEERERRLQEEERERRLQEEARERRLQEEARERRLQEEERERRLQEEERERRLQEEERELRLQEERERRLQEEERERRLQEEERERRLQEERERRLQEEERERRLQEEERELRLQEERERRLQEEERERRLQELRQRGEEAAAAKRREELPKRQEKMGAQGRREAGREPREAPGVGEESRPAPGGRSPLPPQADLAEEAEREHLAPEEQGEDAEQPSAGQKQSPEAEPSAEPQGKRGDAQRQDVRVRGEKGAEACTPGPQQQGAALARDGGREGEELRWREVEERQTMPRPYTFQVSSGGKQILFPKVNLSPVTPARDAGPAPAPHEPKAPRASPAPHALPASLSIPHTAILVTGAQLCGPAVNLSQIKDTACKSLLGLSEEKKHVDGPAPESPPRGPADARAGGKARAAQESPSSAAALAEWASIRSRILRSAEGDPRGWRDPPQPGDPPAPRARCDSRGTPRKAAPVSAKFCIMPAWQKFSDGSAEACRQLSDAEGPRRGPAQGAGDPAAPPPPAAEGDEPRKGAESLEVHQEPADTTEGCKFAKDLPSFLVPSPPHPPQKAAAQAQAEPATAPDSEALDGTGKPDPVTPGGEERASPFGIKLRRTNYSLRFHCDQQAEQKKKKRHSGAAESAGGGPRAPGGAEAAAAVAPRQGASPREDAASSPPSPSPAAQPGPPAVSGQTAAPEHKAANRMPAVPKPALAPKPAGQTPPSSPLCRLSRPHLVELLARRPGKPDLEPSEPCKEGQGDQGGGGPRPPSPPRPEEREAQRGEEEEAERKPAAPPEKPSPAPEAGRKEKPVLQSRHSLDGSKLVEKVETAQPLWITLALQKQKGFREQQATREERKQAREAKQAEKFSKDNVSVSPQPGSSSVSRAGSLHKSTAQPEEKKPETAVSRLERREQLKKANTLPTSVTVEISDSTPPAPLVKEVTKRFSTPDAAPVSTEPAWLALAKRKAKAWSDCPQIIK